VVGVGCGDAEPAVRASSTHAHACRPRPEHNPGQIAATVVALIACIKADPKTRSATIREDSKLDCAVVHQAVNALRTAKTFSVKGRKPRAEYVAA
jgi:hypothetical protein